MTRRLVSAKSPANVDGGADRRAEPGPPPLLNCTEGLRALPPPPPAVPGRALAGRALPGFHTGVGAGRGRTGEMCDVSAGPPVVLICCFSLSYLTHQLGSGSRESLRRKR